MNKKQTFRTTIGGQALIEGILMRGPESISTVVRKSDGQMVEKTENIPQAKNKNPVWGLPFIRGVVSLGESLKLGISALNYSSEVAFGDIEDDGKPSWVERKYGRKAADKFDVTIALIIGCVIPIALFILLPTLLAGTLDRYIGSGIWRNLLEGLIRIVIFLAFMFAVSRMKDIKRTFCYHGAEHKSIFCYEHNEDLTVDNVRRYPKEHPRCGTSFLFMVMIVSILVFSVVSWSNPFIRMAMRILLLPVVISISYEISRILGRSDSLLSRILRAPGLWLQKLTTNEPDDSMMEVAITALKNVIPMEKGADIW